MKDLVLPKNGPYDLGCTGYPHEDNNDDHDY